MKFSSSSKSVQSAKSLFNPTSIFLYYKKYDNAFWSCLSKLMISNFFFKYQEILKPTLFHL